MLRCASSFVIAAYTKVRLIPQDSRALPAAFLRSHPIFTTSKTFYKVVILETSILVAYPHRFRKGELNKKSSLFRL
jgi:hypothetical protein